MTPDIEKVEKSIIALLRQLPSSISKIPFDVMAAIERLQYCTVRSFQEASARLGLSIADIVEYCESSTGCSYKKKGQDKYIILYNNAPDISQSRKTFTLAHELGHISLGHMRALEKSCVTARNRQYSSLETSANMFAAYLLCPAPVLYNFGIASPMVVSSIFGISLASAEISLKNIKGYNCDDNPRHNEVLTLYNINRAKNDDFPDGIPIWQPPKYNESKERESAPCLTKEEKEREAARFERLEEEYLSDAAVRPLH